MIDLQSRLQKTIVFITHDLDEALRLGDRVAIMKDGRVVQLGTPDDIVLNPADDYVASFVEGHDRSEMVTAEHVMVAPAELLRGGHSPTVAARSLDRAGLDHAVVVGPNNQLEGWVSSDALADGARAGLREVRDCALEQLPTAAPDDTLRDLIPVAAAQDRPVAVVEDGRLIGVVGRGAILKGLSDALESDEQDTPASTEPVPSA